MKLERLEVGDRFTIPSLGFTGTLLNLSPGAALVKYDGGVDVVIKGEADDDKPTTFRRAHKPITISRGTEVRRLTA